MRPFPVRVRTRSATVCLFSICVFCFRTAPATTVGVDFCSSFYFPFDYLMLLLLLLLYDFVSVLATICHCSQLAGKHLRQPCQLHQPRQYVAIAIAITVIVVIVCWLAMLFGRNYFISLNPFNLSMMSSYARL